MNNDVQIVHTIIHTERFTPSGFLNDETKEMLKLNGFRYNNGTWFRYTTTWSMTDELAIMTKLTPIA